MKYFVAKCPYEPGDVHIGDCDPKKTRPAYRLLGSAGGPIGKQWPKDVTFKYTPPEAIPLGTLRKDAVATSFAFLIVNAKYKAVFAKLDGLEPLKIQLEIAPKKIVKNWYALNVYDQRAAVDRDRSDWKPCVSPGEMRMITKLVLDRSAVRDQPAVFKLAEMKRVVLVREDVVAAAKQAKLAGLVFIEPARFSTM